MPLILPPMTVAEPLVTACAVLHVSDPAGAYCAWSVTRLFFPFTLAIVTLAVTLMYAPVSLGVPLLVHRYAARDAKIGEK